MENLLIIIGVGLGVIIVTIIGLLSRYRKCKSDQILVVFGKTKGDKSAKCIQGGAAFIWPVIQGYEYMDLMPLQFECDLKKALSSQNIRVDVPTTVTVAISTEPDIMQNAAERLLGLEARTIQELVRDIVYGQLRTIIADMTIEELNADRDKFLSSAKALVETEVKKIGLTLINLNITDIRDEAGYIIALGKKDQSIAINNANVEIATAEQKGAIAIAEQKKIQNSTVAETKKEEAVALSTANRDKESSVAILESTRDSQIAEAKRDRDISVATSNSEGQIGEIEADKAVAISKAELEVVEAEASGRARSAEEKALAEIEKNKELANKESEDARALREEAKLKAEKIVPAEIAKKRKLIDAEAYQLEVEKQAEANANQIKIKAEGDAEATLKKGKAEADVVRMKGLAEAEAKEKSLLAEADGFKAMVEAAEANPSIAIQYKLVNEYEKIAAQQVEAFKHIQLGNVTIMDTASGGNTMDFVKNLVSTVAPALDVVKSMEIPKVSKALRDKENPKKDDTKFEKVK